MILAPRLSASFLILLAYLAMPLGAGCATDVGTSGGPDAPPPALDDDDDDDDDDEVPDPEIDCADGLDDDGDGLTDCMDDDCAAVFHCTWPDEIELQTIVEFFGNELAQSFGVGDCTLEFSGILSEETDALGFDGGDLAYEGSVDYSSSDCPEDYIDRPSTVAFAIVFLDESTREVFSQDSDSDLWATLGEVTSETDGLFRVETLEPVMYDVPIFGETEVGTFRLTRTFRDR
jgi:hypothetical protein